MFPDWSPWSTWAIGAIMDNAMEKATHHLVLTESACHSRHAYLTVPDPGPLRPRVDYYDGWAKMANYAQHPF
jgi:hypothetical protein